jgi:hypothetical protein
MSRLEIQKLQQQVDKVETKKEKIKLLRKIAELKSKSSCIVKS